MTEINCYKLVSQKNIQTKLREFYVSYQLDRQFGKKIYVNITTNYQNYILARTEFEDEEMISKGKGKQFKKSVNSIDYQSCNYNKALL